MKALVDEGYIVTAGVLNLLDTDQETAQLLSIPTTNEAPFSPITDEAHKANLKMIKAAKVLIVAPTQFGEGNFRNLDAAEFALKENIPTILLEDEPIEERDFTNGKAKKYLEKLEEMGAITVDSIEELIKLINNLESENNNNEK